MTKRMTKAQRAHWRHDAMTVRLIERMHAAGIIDAASRDRLLAGPPMADSHGQLGFTQALLSVAVSHVEAHTHERGRRRG